ncbi:MAG TPA: cyclic nucleotide-binding domain-containing protein [Hanamia sp.]|jgi:CRP/FNR family transcriptional regulator, cyclic AMP receptor protein|nr:cyclic nucleotide-binding domain-containing protein [Hanamia sp.]
MSSNTKVSLLKKTGIFKNTPEKDLTDIANILQEVSLKTGAPIFAKGDIGDCMYIIEKGSVRIHDGGYTFAILKENEVFGELSLLDSETRSASATCDQDCLLLKLDQSPFYNILSKDQEVLKGILQMLCRRIRILDEKSAHQ